MFVKSIILIKEGDLPCLGVMAKFKNEKEAFLEV